MPKHEAAGNREIAAAWERRANDLVAWTWERLINRVDVWGAYLPLHQRTSAQSIYTAPAKSQRGKILLTQAILARHYAGRDVGQLIGLHSTSPENTSRWGAVDIDWHGTSSSHPELNLAAALGWYDKLVGLGFAPLLCESNERGGYHLRVLFASPVPTPRVFAFVKWLIGDYGRYGLSAPPEVFPKQPRIEPGRFGNWLRLPGRHHTRGHWSRVWDGAQWLAGAPAVAHLLEHGGDEPRAIPVASCPSVRRSAAALLTSLDPAQRATVIGQRIQAYIDKVSGRGEGEDRGRPLYALAALCQRDLGLSAEATLPWLELLDAKNSPPKGREQLERIAANALKYGRHTMGCGLR